MINHDLNKKPRTGHLFAFGILLVLFILLLTRSSLYAAREKLKLWDKSKATQEDTSGKKSPTQKKLIKRGKKIYRERCAACHGRTGVGNGPGAEISGVLPQDLTDKAYMSLLSDDDLLKRIRYGEDAVPYVQMTGYNNYLASGAIKSVIAYIRTFEVDKGPLKGLTPKQRQERFTDPLERGNIYYLRYCSPCHGISGDGKGWAARTSGGIPIAHNDPILMSKYTRQQIYDHVKGLKKSPTERNMPIFGRTITPKVVKEIATFTKTLPENRDN